MIFNSEPENWQELQSYIEQMFDECGFKTEISKVVDLVRGKKEIDVYACDTNSEYKPTILVECKNWNKPVSQEIVHSFRTVVADFGANLGIIVSKNGFQKGCFAAAGKTNIKLVSSLKELEKMYYVRWKRNMVKRYMPYADQLFPYWDVASLKIPPDGKHIDWDTKQLLYSAYSPICGLGPYDLMLEGFRRKYPIEIPIINDKLEAIDALVVSNDREYFDFIEENKDRAFKHYRLLYREES